MSDLVLVTGGQGYVGGRLVARLRAEQFRVRTTSRNPRAGAASEQIRIDLRSEESLDRVCENVRYVVHLAAMNDAECRNDPEGAYAVNTLATFRLAEAARRAGVERLVYLSTWHVYGSPLAGRISELTPTRPPSVYAMTHRAAEDIALFARGTASGAVLRLSNALGCPADAAANTWMLIANDLCRQAVTARSLGLRTTGLQLRNFIAMEDALSAILHLLRLPAASMGDGLFNVGGPRSTSIYDLARIVATRCENVLGFRPPIHRPEPQPGDVAHAPIEYSIEKFARTGFVLQCSIEAEIDATLLLCERVFAGAA